jgi:hypothetical protein
LGIQSARAVHAETRLLEAIRTRNIATQNAGGNLREQMQKRVKRPAAMLQLLRHTASVAAPARKKTMCRGPINGQSKTWAIGMFAKYVEKKEMSEMPTCNQL